MLSCLGMTTAISLLSDMLCLFTAHIYVCYLVSTIVYHHQLKTAGSLWNLFRGTFLIPGGRLTSCIFVFRQTVQCPPWPNRPMGLRCGSTVIWHHPLHPCSIPLSNRSCILCAIRHGELRIYRLMWWTYLRSRCDFSSYCFTRAWNRC